ncbi:MAG: hypothetical protein ABFE07_03770 [Armatimonadia bacterium]
MSELSLQSEESSPEPVRRGVWVYVLGLALLLGALHSPVLLGRAIYFHDDLWAWFLPVHDYLRHELWSGNRLPWCPLVSCGYPLAAEPQTGVWYPLNLLLAIPLPIGQMMGWLLWLHYFIAAAGVFTVARRLRAGRLPAFCAAAVFTTTGFMIAHLHHVAIITAAAWFPWAWYALLSYRYPNGGADAPRYLLLLGWCSAAQLLAGQPQIWLLTFGSGFALLALAEVIVPPSQPREPGHLILRRWLFLVSAAVLGAGLAGVTLLPMLSLFRLSARSAPSLAFVTSYALSKESLKTFLGLRLNVGDAWEYEAFAGLSTLALSFFAFIRGRNRPLLNLLAALILLSLFMGMAGVNPLYRLFVHLPLLSGLRCAARWLLIISACLSLLAAYGLTILRRLKWLQWAVAAVLVAETAWFGMHYNPLADPDLLKPPASAEMLTGGRIISTTAHALRSDLSPRDTLLFGRQLVIPNLNMMWGLSTADGYMPLQLAHFQRLREQVNWLDPAAAGASGIQWLLAPPGRDVNPAWQLRQVDTSVSTYETQPLSAWLSENPRPEEFTGPVSPALGTASVLSVSSRGVVAECLASRVCYLILPYTWLPWWQATIDGQPTEAVRSNLAFTAIAVPDGISVVELRYVQPRFWLGVAVSLGSGLALLVLLVVSACRPISAKRCSSV